MPALSPTMEEGKLVKWLVREGDRVRAGDVIAEIETDKATMEVEAAEDGKLGKILVAEGSEHVPVNQPIALLLTDGEDAERPHPSRRGRRPLLRIRLRHRAPPPLLTLRRALQRPSRTVRGLKQSKPFPPHPKPLPRGRGSDPRTRREPARRRAGAGGSASRAGGTAA